MSKPIVYLAFANDSDAHLPLLKGESQQLMEALSVLHDKEAIEVYRDESTTVAELANDFNRFEGRLAIFHYGGHAGGSGLQLEKGPAQAEGLARLFSQQKNLQLVFLNGCSTLAQVGRLMELGVRAVIATSVPIEDTRAVDFAGWFYEALALKKNIQKAFDFAVAALKTKYKDLAAPAVIEYRGIKLNDESAEALPWGLYINETHKDVLNWRLPDTSIRRLLSNPLTDYTPNDYLPRILGAMARYAPSLNQIILQVRAGKKDKREVLPIIIEHLPWAIGAQLQKLVSRSESMRTPGPERLQQTINTYVAAAQVLLYILASQLWEEQRKAEQPLSGQPLSGLLSLDENGAHFFDYVAALGKVGRLFQENGWTPFVQEFTLLFEALEQKGPFYQSYLLLESIREQLSSGSLDNGAVPQLCEEAENSLALFIGTISFLIKYEMMAIREISVAHTRFGEVSYLHKMGTLNATDSAYLTLGSTPRPFRNHAESGSVLLVKGLELEDEVINEYLSLSPFIIDNNAFLDKTQESLDIYLFSHVENEEYAYKNANSQFQKMERYETYTITSAYIEKVPVKDELDFGWEFNRPSFKTVRPYALLKDQFERMKKDLGIQ